MKLLVKKKWKVGFVIRRIFAIFFIFISLGITYTLAKAVGENYVADKMIADFISRAAEAPAETTTNYGYTWNYYPLERIHDYELNDERNVFYDDAKRELGQFGDILLTRQSAFKNIPIIHQFISYYFGGHSAFRDENAGLYETTGMNVSWDTFFAAIKNKGYNSGVENASIQHLSFNYWFDRTNNTQYAPFYREEMMSVRIKYVTLEQIQAAQQYLDYQVSNHSLYNFLYWLDMDQKHYCTDLMSRAYQSAFYEADQQKKYARSLNDDGFITSVNDILLAKQTYLTSYVTVDHESETFNLYYLKDIV